MIHINFTFGDIKKEQTFINQYQKKGESFYKKFGCFYFFHSTDKCINNSLIVEIIPQEVSMLDDDSIHLIAQTKIPFTSFNKIYYAYKDESLHITKVNQDANTLLHYYKQNLTKFRVMLYSLIFLLLTISGINYAINTSFRANRINLLLYTTILFIAITYYFLTKSTKDNITRFSIKVDEPLEMFDLKFVVQISNLNEENIKKFKKHSAISVFGNIGSRKITKLTFTLDRKQMKSKLN